jgi:ferredoxin-type protein NapF
MRFISGHAKIAMSSCMSHHQTVCFSCKEPCLEDAIVFSGMFNPIILGEKCTGCGYCISVCPAAAIEMVA